jgi:hypothetical protein
MASVSLTISDKLNAKITAHWGSTTAWKDWVKEATREQVRQSAVRKAQEDANADLRDAIAAIDADAATDI